MKFIRRSLALIAVTSTLSSSGCVALVVGGAAAAAAVGAVIYLEGELESTESVSLDQAWNATQQAMKDLEFSVEGREKDAVFAKLKARGADDKTITVTLRRVAAKLTKISIRVGTFGDESLSRHILATIKRFV